MEWRLELVQVPVSDVDRAKAFYTDKAGFNADHDHRVSDEMRFVQLTPPGSPTSIAIGTGITDMAPGSLQGLQMVVAGHRRRARRTGRGDVDVSDVQHFPWGSFVFFSDPDGNGWAVQAIPRLAAATRSAAKGAGGGGRPGDASRAVRALPAETQVGDPSRAERGRRRLCRPSPQSRSLRRRQSEASRGSDGLAVPARAHQSGVSPTAVARYHPVATSAAGRISRAASSSSAAHDPGLCTGTRTSFEKPCSRNCSRRARSGRTRRGRARRDRHRAGGP